MATDQQIIEEYLKRNKEDAPPFSIDGFCFKQQKEFLESPARFKTAVCGRRSGKTVACAADLIHTCVNNENVQCLYITLSRGNAKRIIWHELKRINRNFDLKGKPNESDLSITFQNDSIIWLSGAKDQGEIEKFRGMKLKKIYIDEAQSFKSYIKRLINDVLRPTLWDLEGSLIMIGTPGPVPAGPFYEAAHATGEFKDWENFGWNALKNPHIPARKIWKEENLRKGITERDPTFQREALGKWVQDSDALVFKFSHSKNAYTIEQFGALEYDWQYVIGIDTGFHDADAIAVLAFSDSSPHVYLVEEYVKRGQTVTSLMNAVRTFQMRYNPVKLVIDSAAGGRKMAEEYRQRYGVHMDAAEKSRKFEFIELMNDDLRTGKLKIRRDFQAIEDMQMVQWNRDTPLVRRIDDSFHSDILDALLYGWREARHFFYTEELPAARMFSPQWYKEEAERMEQVELDRLANDEKKDGDEWWEKDYDNDIEELL